MENIAVVVSKNHNIVNKSIGSTENEKYYIFSLITILNIKKSFLFEKSFLFIKRKKIEFYK